MLIADRAKISQKLKYFGILYSAFTAFFIAYFSPVVLTGRLLAPDDDRTMSLPAFLGERTIWSPDICSGWPVHADPLAQIWYPLSLFLSRIPLPVGWNLFIISGYSLCSVFLFLYVKELTGKRFPALVSAFLFPLSGAMIAEMRHAPIVHSMFYFLAILFFIEKLAKHSSLYWVGLGAATFGFCALNGHMQFVAYILGLVVLYSLFRCLTMKEGQSKFLLNIGLIVVIGLAIGAVQILPTWELAKFSVRSKFAFIDFLSYCCHPIQAIGLFTPFVLGAADGSFFKIPYFGLDFRPPHFLYVGIIPMLCFFGALLLVRNNAITWFWMAIGTIAFLLSFGNSTPLAWLLYNIPPYGSFRALSLLYLFAAAAGSIVSGLILSRLMDAQLTARRTRVFAATMLCLACGAISTSVQLVQEIIELPERSAMESAVPPFWENPAILIPFYLSLFALFLFLAWLRKPNTQAMQIALLVVAVADLAFVGWFNEWRSMPLDVASVETPAALLKIKDELRSSHYRLLPVRGVSGGDDECPPNLSRLWGIPSASGFGPLLNTRYLEFLDITEGGFVPVPWTFTSEFRSFDLLAVKYLTVPHGDTRLDAYRQDGKPIFKKVAECGKADLFENVRALPRLWMVGEARLMADSHIVRAIHRGEMPDGTVFEPRRLALLSNSGMKAEGFATPPQEMKVENFSGTAKIVAMENRTVKVETDSATSGFLILADLFYPGWKVVIDGKPGEIVRTDYILRGVALSSGKHSVEFRYEPIYLYVGGSVSVLGLLLLLGIFLKALKGQSVSFVEPRLEPKPEPKSEREPKPE